MNYKDLMPDDLINTEADGCVRVTFPTPTSVVYFGGICPIKQASPIPLTEEILVKNGFKVQKTHDNGRWLHLTDTLWLSYSNRYNVWYTDGIKIYFIHQLQHLLRLCGIEKEIEL